MWRYEKRLQYPVKISQPNPKMAQFIMSQYGGPDGEMGASMRYLSQRYAMPYDIAKASLTDIGTEELAHLEIVAAIVHQLTRNLTPQEIEDSGRSDQQHRTLADGRDLVSPKLILCQIRSHRILDFLFCTFDVHNIICLPL